MKQYNNEKYIISFTSFTERFDDACKMIYSLQKQTYKDWHLVITVFKDDIANITQSLQALIDNNWLELIVAEKDLGPHLKYFYAMQKYWDKPIITVDDDRLYSPNTIQALVDKYESLEYKSIVANCATKMSKRDNILCSRRIWCVPWHRLKPGQMSHIAMAEGFAGILYPPQCFNNLSAEIDDIKRCLYDDDLFLRVLGIKNAVPVTQTDVIFGKTVMCVDIIHAQNFALAKKHNAGLAYRTNVTKLFNDELIKGFEL